MTLGIVLLAASLALVMAGLWCWGFGIGLGFGTKLCASILVFCSSISGTFLVCQDFLDDKSQIESSSTNTLAAAPPEAISDAGRQRLEQAHEDTVRIFIDQPGFGNFRMITLVDIRDVVKSTSSSITWQPWPFVAMPGARHRATNKHVAIQPFGQMWQTGDRFAGAAPTQWKLNDVKLIGLAKHPAPVVYLTGGAPVMPETKDAVTRKMDEFESNALDRLRAGKSLEIENHGANIRMLGPIFAGASCIGCHEQRGQMLGAFSYTIERSAKGEENLP